jgi:hypothetical protein
MPKNLYPRSSYIITLKTAVKIPMIKTTIDNSIEEKAREILFFL